MTITDASAGSVTSGVTSGVTNASTTWLDGEDYTSEFWSVPAALSSILSTIAKAMAEMESAA